MKYLKVILSKLQYNCNSTKYESAAVNSGLKVHGTAKHIGAVTANFYIEKTQ